MSKVLIKFRDGHTEVHYGGPFSDYTVCGHDTDGETDWDHSIPTDKKVTCERCLTMVRFCKAIRLPRKEKTQK